MKKAILLLLVASSSIFAKANKVAFIDNDWTKACYLAKQQHKYLFVDAYTDWCSWCKVMDKQTFPDSQVVAFMNSNFVSLKLEMEHNFGITVSMKYLVNAFPTYLVFSPEGKLVYQVMGYMPPKDFIEKLGDAVNPAKQSSFPGISDKVQLDFPEFYKKSYGEKTVHVSPDSITVSNYLDAQTDLTSEVNRLVIEKFFKLLSPKYRNYFLDNHQKYAQLYGEEEVLQILGAVAQDKLKKAIGDKSETGLQDALNYARTVYPKFDEGGKEDFTIAYYKGVGDWKKFAALIDQSLSRDPKKDPYTINDWCWTVYEKAEDQEVIEKALAWMQPVINAGTDYAIIDTYASLLFKAKKLDEASKYAQLAIATGKKSGDNTKSTEELLVKIQEAKKTGSRN